MDNAFFVFFEDFRIQEEVKRQHENEELFERAAARGEVGLQKYDWTPLVVEVLEKLRDVWYPECRIYSQNFFARPFMMVTDRFSKSYDWAIMHGEDEKEYEKVVVSLVFDENQPAVGFAVYQPISSRVVKAKLERESSIEALKEFHTEPIRLRVYKKHMPVVGKAISKFIQQIKNNKYEYTSRGMGLPCRGDDFSDLSGLPEHVGDWQISRKQLSSTLFSQKEENFQEVGFVRIILDQQKKPICFAVYFNKKKAKSGLSEGELFQSLMDLYKHPLKWGDTQDETKSIIYQMQARSHG